MALSAISPHVIVFRNVEMLLDTENGTYLVLIKLSCLLSAHTHTTVSYDAIGIDEREREREREFIVGRTLDALLSYSVERPDLVPSTGYLRQVP